MTQQDPPKDSADPAGIPADFPEAYSRDSVPCGFSESKLHFGRETVIVAVIILLALALRVLFIYQVQTSEVDGLRALKPGTDMLTYDNIARWVIKHGWYEKSADVSPLYPYVFLPLAYIVTSGSIFWAKILQALVSTGTVLLVYLMARRLYGNRAAIYAAVFACVYAPFVVYQGQILGEFLLDFLVALFFLAMLGIDGRISYRRAALAGAVLGLAVAAKPTAVVFAPIALIWIFRRAGWNGKAIRAAAAPAALFLLCAVAVTLPFTWRNWKATGGASLVRGNSGIMLYMGNNASANGAYKNPSDEASRRLDEATRSMTLPEKDRAYRRAAIDFIEKNPKRFLSLLARKALLFFGAEEASNNISVRFYRQLTFVGSWVFVSWGLVLPLAATGMALSIRRRGVLMAAGAVLLYAGAIIAFIVVDRYRLAVVPLLLPAAGFAAYEAVLALRTLDMKRLGVILLAVACIAAPVNAFQLGVTVQQRLHPAGFLDRAGNGRVVLHDDSGAPTPFNVMFVTPEAYMTKFLILRRPLSGLQSAAVLIQLKVTATGTLSVALNDSARNVPLIPMDTRWLRVEFPPEAVDAGTNAITLRTPDGLRVRVYADEVFNFGRSIYSPDGMDMMTDRLDQTTYDMSPSLYMGGRELKVRLELDYGPQPE